MVIFVHYVYLHTRDTYDCVRIVKKKNRTNLPEPCDENRIVANAKKILSTVEVKRVVLMNLNRKPK